MVRLVKSVKDIPCAIGFGISTPEQAKKMSESADGVIVGSAIEKLLQSTAKTALSLFATMLKV